MAMEMHFLDVVLIFLT